MKGFGASVPREALVTKVSLSGVPSYVVIFPESFTHDDEKVYKDISRSFEDNDVPVILDFFNVERFDSYGLAFILAMLIDQPQRKFYSKNIVPIVQNHLDLGFARSMISSRLQPFPANYGASLDAKVA